MSSSSTQLKLGLLVIAALVAAGATAFGLGLHARKPKVRFHTYFDESVAGLEVGSPVAFRGVRVGSVGAIAIAPDRKRIDVALDIGEDHMSELAPGDLAATLEVSGITGIKLVNLEPRAEDFVPPPLSFAPAERYIPSHPSLLAELEMHADHVASRASVFADHATATLDKLGALVNDVEQQRIVPRAAALLAHADDAVGDLRHLVRGVDRSGLPHQALQTLARADTALAQAGQLFGHADLAVGRLGDLAGNLDASDDLPQTLRDLGDAARAIRDLADEIERQPEILLKGRARSRDL